VPFAPPRPCRGSRTARRCPTLVTSKDGWCPACQAIERKARDATPVRVDTLAFYRSKPWRSTRREVLARDPVCKVCELAVSQIGDHYPRTLRWYLERGDLAGALDPANVRGVCKLCHDRRSGSQGRETQLRRMA
jgi:5-methylcytosine-specific restriction enzyme A